MDNNEPASVEENKTVTTQKPDSQKPKTAQAKKSVMLLIALLLALASAGGGYYWGTTQAEDKADRVYLEKDDIINQLELDNKQLQKELDEVEKTADPEVVESCPTDLAQANIEAAVQSKNYAALEDLMANPVTVILAASEGLGPRTPVQAVGDIEYLSGGTGTWDFSLPAAELTSYADGFYTEYFPDSALVGKSANDYLVSFTFNADCKISVIFMTSSTDLLL